MKAILKRGLLLILALYSYAGIAQNSILWEVSGNDITNTVYLMGTLKFIGENEYVLPKVVEEKLKASAIFAIEDQVDHHAQHELNKAVHFPKGESLATVLSKEEYAKVQEFFNSEFGISKKVFKKKFSRLIPLALSITMTRLSLNEGLKFYDIELLKLANDYQLETYSLETIEREAEALHAFPMKDQVVALLHSIDNFEKQKSEYIKLEAAYTKGDIDKVFEYTLHPFESNQVFVNKFYYERNEEWLPKIEKMMTEQDAFVAVGVSHLEGDRGLLTLLREKGYTLNPISIK
ncbi:MAG: TraB/GumN family protein [Cyclobacteriaceae bacterium]